MRTKGFLSGVLAIGALSGGLAASAGAQESEAFELRLFQVNTAAAAIPLQIRGETFSYSDRGGSALPFPIFDRTMAPGQLVVGDVQVHTDGTKIYWDGSSKRLPDGVSSGGIRTLSATQDDGFVLTSNAVAQFFEGSEDGKYMLRGVMDGEATLKVREREDGQFQLDLSRKYVSGREPLNGVNLEVGPPVFDTSQVSVPLKLDDAHWRIAVLTTNPFTVGNSVWVLMMRRATGTIPDEPVRQFSATAQFLTMPSAANLPQAGPDEMIVLQRIEHGRVLMPLDLNALPPGTEVLSAPRVTTVYSDAQEAAHAQGRMTTQFKLLLKNQVASPGDASGARGDGGFGGSGMAGPLDGRRPDYHLEDLIGGEYRYFLEGPLAEKPLGALPQGFALIVDMARYPEAEERTHGVLVLVHARQTVDKGRPLVDIYACYRKEAVIKRKKVVTPSKNYWVHAVYECGLGETVTLAPEDPEGETNLVVLVTIDAVDSAVGPSPS